MAVFIIPLVEGPSEVESVPVLFRRIISGLEAYQVKVAKPFRVKRNRVVKEGEIERAVRQAIRTRNNPGGIFILLDADDDCPKELSAALWARCKNETTLPVSVILAKKEFESWLLGAKESLRGMRGIKPDAVSPTNPENIRGAKELISNNMEALGYLEVDDQPAFAEKMDLSLAQKRCPSFDKFLRETKKMILELENLSG